MPIYSILIDVLDDDRDGLKLDPCSSLYFFLVVLVSTTASSWGARSPSMIFTLLCMSMVKISHSKESYVAQIIFPNAAFNFGFAGLNKLVPAVVLR